MRYTCNCRSTCSRVQSCCSGGSDQPLGLKQLHQLAQVSLLVFTQSKPSYLINILVKKGRKGHIVRPSNERETSVERLSSLSVSGDVRGGLGKLVDTKLCHKSSHELCHRVTTAGRPDRDRKAPTVHPLLLQYMYVVVTMMCIHGPTVYESRTYSTHVTVASLEVASSHVVVCEGGQTSHWASSSCHS